MNLAQWVFDELVRERVLDRHALHFLESVAGAEGEAAIEAFLKSSDSTQTMPFLELVLFPDESALKNLLPQVWGTCSEVLPESDLVSRVSGKHPKARIRMPETGTLLEIPVPEEAIAGVVGRLNIFVTVPRQIERALRDLPDPELSRRLGVAVRGLEIQWDKQRIDFFCGLVNRLTEKAPFSDPDGNQVFEGILELLNIFRETGAAKGPMAGLLAKRDWCRHHLEREKNSREDLAGVNMETRILSGIRPPHIDTARLGRILHNLDCLIALIGKDAY